MGKPKNLMGNMGLRSKRSRRTTTPPKMTPHKAQSISASLGISTHPIPASNESPDDSLDNLELNQFMPLRDEPEAPAFPIPDAANHFAQESREWWNAEARRTLKHQWNAIESPMTATYLDLQHDTRNWTSEASYLDVDIDCQCPNSQLTMQPVDLIDVLGFHSKRQILFCGCMPKPVRLLHYGYISSSPQSPRTAFSVRLLQFHHQLWNTTVISSIGFINGLMSFLNLRSKTNLKPQSHQYRSLIHERDLRRQFSNSVNMYRAIILCTKKIYNEGLKLSNAQLLADRCGRCFGPAINEEHSPQEPHVIVALDGNFQHRHYTQSSKDNPTEDEYPEIFIKPSLMTKHEILQHSTEAQAKNIKVTDWLLRRLRNANTVLRDTQSALYRLSREKSSLFPTIRYTYEFLREQWILERNSQNKRCHIQEEQKIELGRLLCLEEMAQEIWDRDAGDVNEAISRLNEHTNIKKRIEKQRSKIGSEAILNDLNAQEQDQMLKIWYAKQEVRNQFVAICEQKRPLEVSRRDGKNSSIGYNDKTHLLKSLRDQAAKLKTKLETYQKLVVSYSTTSPHRSQPASITYLELLEIDFDHSFWNDGLFTNGREPWAVDSNTQHGMRQVAYYDRANEEIRRLGWEVRRVMRWAIDLHESLSTHLCRLQARGPPDNDPLPLVDHPALISLSSAGKIKASKVILNERLVKILNLQADWNKCLGEVLHSTPSQEGDNDLKLSWRNQIQRIHTMYSQDAMSLNPGTVTDFWRVNGTRVNNQVDDEVLPEHESESEGVTNTDGDLKADSSDEDIDPEWEDIREAIM
ncbi:hypothetical protein DFH28DRAFT_1052197 [Melampsora americana]|nr:hypothetical protein DFH28DRAFT_1052197 [Melampsora americana]